MKNPKDSRILMTHDVRRISLGMEELFFSLGLFEIVSIIQTTDTIV